MTLTHNNVKPTTTNGGKFPHHGTEPCASVYDLPCLVCKTLLWLKFGIYIPYRNESNKFNFCPYQTI